MEHRLSTGSPIEGMTIDQLSQQIIQVQDVMQVHATHAINLSLTARNWLIGHHIVEYEQCGKDRAQYGTQLLNNLATKINRCGLNARRLREFRLFYSRYPQLGPEVISFIGKLVQGNNDIAPFEIWRSPTAKLQNVENLYATIKKYEEFINKMKNDIIQFQASAPPIKISPLPGINFKIH